MWFCMLATNYVVRLQVIMGMVDGLTTLCGCSVHPVGVLFVNWQSSITDLLYVCDLFLCLFLWNWSKIWLMLYLDWLQALPAWFVRDKGDEFHRFVTLECGASGRVWPACLFVSGEVLQPRVMEDLCHFQWPKSRWSFDLFLEGGVRICGGHLPVSCNHQEDVYKSNQYFSC